MLAGLPRLRCARAFPPGRWPPALRIGPAHPLFEWGGSAPQSPLHSMTQATLSRPTNLTAAPRDDRSPVGLFRALELDTRLLGMLLALAIIWLGFQVLSGGLFLTPRNLWNLSVQSASIAIMATGMVLIIVSRNIDLSVGSLLGFLGYTMAVVQVQWIPNVLHLGFNQPYTWLVALAVGIVFGALIGALQGVIVAYGGVPAFIVTLGGFL